MPRTSAKERIRQFLRERVGQVVTSHDLQAAAGQGVTEWARRVREIRTEEGWLIRSHHDDRSLRPGEYRLDSLPDESYVFERPLSTRLRAQVLERNGYTCQMCGAGAGDVDTQNPTRRIRLHVGHIQDRSHGGSDTLSNLRALCNNCNEGAQNIAQEPPSWSWLYSQVRRAREDDQRQILEFLKQKFEN